MTYQQLEWRFYTHRFFGLVHGAATEAEWEQFFARVREWDRKFLDELNREFLGQ